MSEYFGTIYQIYTNLLLEKEYGTNNKVDTKFEIMQSELRIGMKSNVMFNRSRDLLMKSIHRKTSILNTQ